MNRHLPASVRLPIYGLSQPIDVTWSLATSVSMEASWVSDDILIPTYFGLSLDALWDNTGSPIGIILAEVTNGLSYNTFGSWLNTVGGAQVSAGWDIDSNFYIARLRYERTSGGTGAICRAKFFSKG